MISGKAIPLSRRSENPDGRACRTGFTTILQEAAGRTESKRISAPESSFRLLLTAVLGLACFALPARPQASVTFYRDILPILQGHCQGCHRAGEMAPMPLETYKQTRPFAAAIKDVTSKRIMPPWFADPCC